MPGEFKRAVVVIATGFESYQTTFLQGVCSVLLPLGIPVVGYANHNDVVAFEHIDHETSVSPFLSCLLRHHRPLGVILMAPLTSAQQQTLTRLMASLGIPVVYVAQNIPGQDCVGGDNLQGMRAVMKHLLDEQGARRPTMVRGLSHQPDHVAREAVFREEVARRGLPIDEELFVDGKAEREVTRNKMRNLLSRRRDIDAVVTIDDACALAVIDTVAEVGLRVPEDVAVTGFDNCPVATLSWPGITTIDQNIADQGSSAARLLLGRIQGGPPRGTVLTPCSLIVRGSTIGDRAKGTNGETTVETVARAAQAQQTAQNTCRRISLGLASCRTLDQIGDALADSLHLLGIERFFLVVHQGMPDEPDSDGVIHRTSRLLLDYRKGRSHPVPDPIFSSCSLLPDNLREELARGYLGFQPLVETSGAVGYMLIDHALGPVTIAEQFRVDLSSRVKVLLSTQELEERVEHRTRELRAAQGKLVDSARKAGMAEIATNVLHNVGNVLNSVTVSAGLVMDKMRAPLVERQRRAAELLVNHQADLGTFLTHDPKGKLLPEYLAKLSTTLSVEHRAILNELSLLAKNIDHIRTIVTTQQFYAGNARMVEPARVSEVIDDALHIHSESLTRHEVAVIKEVAEIPILLLDKGCIVMILVNLIGNAKSAMDQVPQGSRVLTIGAFPTADRALRLTVKDAGEGIRKENLHRIFTHGFTTRRGGHGFGLHSCALAASEMGGTLTVHSDGPGLGAVFTLELPMKTP